MDNSKCEAILSRRLKPVKDLSILILAPRKHDRQLWADLLKNCDIRNPLSMSDIKQASITVGSGQVDVVFVDESYGPQGIANLLIPARNVEFAGGRGVCLILCSKKATAQDVMNARKLGFASLVILPASTGTVQKHLELAARYIPMSDKELGWSAPKIAEHRETKAMPTARSDPSNSPQSGSSEHQSSRSAQSKVTNQTQGNVAEVHEPTAIASSRATEPETETASSPADILKETQTDFVAASKATTQPDKKDEPLERLTAPGRSGQTADEELVFL